MAQSKQSYRGIDLGGNELPPEGKIDRQQSRTVILVMGVLIALFLIWELLVPHESYPDPHQPGDPHHEAGAHP